LTFIQTVAVAFSVFSRLPVPQFQWNEKNMRYMLCAFPLVGAFIGLFLWLWTLLSRTLGFSAILYAAGITLIPVLITGGIHLDGFCDTADALASHAEPARRREILKDPHSGAFAIIGACTYMLAYFALAAELKAEPSAALVLGIMHILSRTLSGISVISFPASSSNGLLAGFRQSAEKKLSFVLLLVTFVLAAAAIILLSRQAGAVMVFAALLCFLCLFFISKKLFGGMSGDLAGWFLQLAELFMLASFILIEKVISL